MFLDFVEAFDSVNYDILFSKLEYYRVRGIPLKWFKSYLQNKQQCAKINSKISDFQAIFCRVPQGCVLGPLLLLIIQMKFSYLHQRFHFIPLQMTHVCILLKQKSQTTSKML